MRILFITNIMSPYRIDFLNQLSKHCNLFAIFERENASDRDPAWIAGNKLGFNYIVLKGRAIGTDGVFSLGIKKYLSKKWDAIILGVYHTPTAMVAIHYMKKHKIPFILNTDGGMKKNDNWFKYKIKCYFIGAASAWLSSGKMASEYLQYYGAKQDRIFVYPFTSVREEEIISQALTEEEKHFYKKKLNMSERKIVLSVGQFIPRKGIDILLNACDGLDKSIGVYIVGGQPTEEYLKIQKEKKLTNVHFVDFMKKEAISEYYKAADLFVLPTREDIWGLVINEAISYGLPVITTNKCGAGVEILNDSIGKVVATEDVKAIRDELRKLPFDNQLFDITLVHKKARQYTIEKMAIRHIEIIEEIIARRN